MSMPDFSRLSPRTVAQYSSGTPYILQRIDIIPVTPDRIREATEICNEPLVYNFLFQHRLYGAPYTPLDAQALFDWGAKGWKKMEYFVFAVTTQTGELAAALDIKTPSLDLAEIGYWCSAKHSGVMTNSILELLKIAQEAGYQKLFARARRDNERSLAVLRRCGFLPSPELNDEKQNLIALSLNVV